VRDIDLALHLPLRYEDETRIVSLRDAREGDEVQIEAVVTANEVSFRPRRQLLVTVDDGSDTCTLRFFNFYPSQQKALAVGTRVRARGEVRGGFSGRTMMHPVVRAAAGALPDALTPVYPTVAGLPQAYLRRAVATALERADLSETLPAAISDRNAGVPAWDLRRSLTFLHRPTPEVSIAELEARSHPAWQRLKAEELLAQQLSQLQAKRERDRLRAPSLCAHPGGLHERLLAALPFGLTGAQRSVGEEIACDLARAVPMHRLSAGRCGLRQDRGGGAGRCHRHRRRLAVRADGAHRDPGRAALQQADWLAGAAGHSASRGSAAARRRKSAVRCWSGSSPVRPRWWWARTR
jgi:ATP-dependent DNA helicase RecG